MKKWVRILLVVALVLATAFVTFYVTVQEFGVNTYGADGYDSQGEKMRDVFRLLDRYFIDDYDEAAAGDAAVEAVVDATGDRWSYYVPADEYAEYEEQVTNSYAGIGITIRDQDDPDGFTVETVTAASPAEAAGVQVGDILSKVAGEFTRTLGMDETKNRVRGEAGTKIKLTFVRDGAPYEKEIARAAIQTPVATASMLEDSIGYIRIANFDENCATQTLACIEDLLAQGAKGIVFDVRFNPGGLKSELVTVLDRILPEGDLFTSLSYDGSKETDVSDKTCVDVPMAVLINGDSYSAAEFFAAALQEYDRAEIVGEKTCGKGNYQNCFRLKDGSALNISVGKYFTPLGKSLTDVGVTPDVTVTLSDEDAAMVYASRLAPADDEQLQSALAAVREMIR